MRRFFYYVRNTLKTGETFPLTEEIFHHWCKVLRANMGDTALLFDGTGGEYTATLTQIDKKSALVKIENFNAINRTLPFKVDIGLVMSRGERMDYAVQKATEMGVNHIHLLTSQHGEVRLKPDQIAKKLEHWQGVAIAACEQCGLNIVPQILAPIAISDFIQHPLEAESNSQKHWQKLVLAVPDDRTNWENFHPNTVNFTQTNFCLLIGAEGGLCDDEVNLALQHGFLPWQIGERVLRTETAPVVALASLQAWASLQ